MRGSLTTRGEDKEGGEVWGDKKRGKKLPLLRRKVLRNVVPPLDIDEARLPSRQLEKFPGMSFKSKNKERGKSIIQFCAATRRGGSARSEPQ